MDLQPVAVLDLLLREPDWTVFRCQGSEGVSVGGEWVVVSVDDVAGGVHEYVVIFSGIYGCCRQVANRLQSTGTSSWCTVS